MVRHDYFKKVAIDFFLQTAAKPKKRTRLLHTEVRRTLEMGIAECNASKANTEASKDGDYGFEDFEVHFVFKIGWELIIFCALH